MEESSGMLKDPGFLTRERRQEVFHAELLGIVQALQLARNLGVREPVTVFLDSNAATSRLQHTQTESGQAQAIQAHTAAQVLQSQGRQPIIQCVPGHAEVEGNERADKAAKQTTNKPPNISSGGISLAFTRRARTDAINTHKRSWLAGELAQRPQMAQRTTQDESIDISSADMRKLQTSRPGFALLDDDLVQWENWPSPEIN